MRDVGSFDGIFLYVGRVDFRKWIDGLSSVVMYEMSQSVTENCLYVFVSNCRRKLKIMYWDKTGYAVWYKRLETEKFPRISSDKKSLSLSIAELKFFLEGGDFSKIKKHKKREIMQNF
jgi:transposase